MAWLTAYLVCAGVTALLQAEVQGSFLVKPTSVVVPIEGTGIFECRAFGVAVYWYINQEQATHLHLTRGVSSASKVLTDGSWNSTLSVLATPENNNSMVECAVFTFETGETRSPGVSIMIVGMLQAPPVNFMIVQRNASCIQISWTLPDIILTVVIGFNIYINNTQTGQSENVTVKAHRNDFTYTPTDPSPCHIYEFHITITHEGGEGETSEVIEGSLITEPSSIQAESVYVVVGFLLDEINITLMIKMNDSCNVDNYTVHLYSEGTFGSIHTGLNGSSVDEEDTIVLVLTASYLHVAENTHYTVVITAVNDIGHTNSSGMIRANFSAVDCLTTGTFDVQNVTAEEETPGILCITCYFAGGSDATGCSVRIQSTKVMEEIRINRAHPSASMCIDVIKGVYNISAYDLEKDGERSQLPAYIETSKSVEGGATTSSTTEAESDNIGLVVITTVSTVIVSLIIGVSILLVVVVCYVWRESLRDEEGKSKDKAAKEPHKIPASDNDSPIIETKRNTSYETNITKDAIHHNPAYEAVKL